MNNSANGQSWEGSLQIPSRRLPDLLPTLADQAGFRDLRVRASERIAVASQRQTIQGSLGSHARDLTLSLEWTPSGPHGPTQVGIAVHHEVRPGVKYYHKDVAEHIASLLARLVASLPATSGETLLAPGETSFGRITGTLRDYSGCATPEAVADLSRGTLPLGRWAFERRVGEVHRGAPLYLSTFPNGDRMEYRGVLVCAPTGAGKTELIIRWARAANAAGYCTLIVDVKGSMFDKLGSLNGRVFRLSTERKSDRINFLSDLETITPTGHDGIRQFGEALLPGEGWRNSGDEELRYQQRIAYLVAFVHLIKLRELYYPRSFGQGTRKADLSDLYELVFRETDVCRWIAEIREAEAKNLAAGKRLPPIGVDHWATVLAPMLDPKLLPGVGQRTHPHYGYADYVRGILLALEPFSRQGLLRRAVRSFGKGHPFSMAELHQSQDGDPTTIILEAREQDGDAARAMLALAIRNLQPIIFQRWNLTAAEKAKIRPILLLFDESRRIRQFRADEFITIAREAHAGCVMVYQNLDQVQQQLGDAGLNTILENTGIQIYLRSLVGNTANHFIRILPERYRTLETINNADGSVQSRSEVIPYFTKGELYQLPAGEYPAVVLIRGRPNPQPILVDMDTRYS